MDDSNKYKCRLRDGHLYDPWLAEGPAPSPETIAWGLAGLNRYGAHTLRHLSVAEHSLWIAICISCNGHENKVFKKIADLLGQGLTKHALTFLPKDNAENALFGLTHDCPEATGLVDVPSPITRHIEMTAYKAAHDRCARWLSVAWGIQPPPWPAIVKETDHSILGAEMAIRPKSEDQATGSGEIIPPWPNLNLWGWHDLSRYGTAFVREAWISAFYALKNIVDHDRLVGKVEESQARSTVAMNIK